VGHAATEETKGGKPEGSPGPSELAQEVSSMTRSGLPALRFSRRRIVAGLAFAALCVPAGASAAYDGPSNAVVVPNGTLPANFQSDAASNRSTSAGVSSSDTLPANFRSEATDGHAQQPAPQTVTVVASDTNGFDWGDAGIGAAVILGLLAIGGGMTLLVSHHRHHTPGGPAIAG
jgi:hypothetical protein